MQHLPDTVLDIANVVELISLPLIAYILREIQESIRNIHRLVSATIRQLDDTVNASQILGQLDADFRFREEDRPRRRRTDASRKTEKRKDSPYTGENAHHTSLQEYDDPSEINPSSQE